VSAYQFDVLTLNSDHNSLTLRDIILNVHAMNAIDKKQTELTLALLDAVSEDSGISQRSLARQLGVALGLANAQLRACARRGFIAITAISKRRFNYDLTDFGERERMRLARHNLSISLAPYAEIRRACDAVIDQCRDIGATRLVFAGQSHLADIAFVSALDRGVDVVGLIAMPTRPAEGGMRTSVETFCNQPVWHGPQAFAADQGGVAFEVSTDVSMCGDDDASFPRRHDHLDCHAIVITDLVQPQAAAQALDQLRLPIFAPSILRLALPVNDGVGTRETPVHPHTAVSGGRTRHAGLRKVTENSPLYPHPKVSGAVSG